MCLKKAVGTCTYVWSRDAKKITTQLIFRLSDVCAQNYPILSLCKGCTVQLAHLC